MSVYPNGSRTKPPVPRLGHYGPRDSPGGIGTKIHKGTDFALPYGTPLVATDAGTVTYCGYKGGWGNHVQIEWTESRFRIRATYSHMISATEARVGQKVAKGQKVGRVGLTGNTTGPHVHYEVLVNGEYTDPEPFLANRIDRGQQSSGSTPGTTTPPKPAPIPQEDTLSDAEVKKITEHVTAERKELAKQVSAERVTIQRGIRREGRARLYFDSGVNGELTADTATRACAAKITDGFLYWLNPDPKARAGQMASLRRGTHYLLIDADEAFEGLRTPQFENLLEMIDGHLDRIADRVIQRQKRS